MIPRHDRNNPHGAGATDCAKTVERETGTGGRGWGWSRGPEGRFRQRRGFGEGGATGREGMPGVARLVNPGRFGQRSER